MIIFLLVALLLEMVPPVVYSFTIPVQNVNLFSARHLSSSSRCRRLRVAPVQTSPSKPMAACDPSGSRARHV